VTEAGATSARPEEIEVKLPCEDLQEIREALRKRSAALRRPEHHEINDHYDDDAGRLQAKGCTLRLRRAAGETILTYKGPASFEGGIKTREEREVRVSDAEELEAILAGAGFARRFRYEKRREDWSFAGCAISLDETPIGRFIEIEGNPVAIRAVMSEFGLEFEKAIPYSYAKLYQLRREEEPRLPPDMVFERRSP
jgi:adenylate cyclase class 2